VSGRQENAARLTTERRISKTQQQAQQIAHPAPRCEIGAPTEARRLRRQRYAARIWGLGDRALFELVDHIAGRFGIEDEIDHLLGRFARLSPAVLRALGADKLPLPPIRLWSDAP
jgi:hypothetical protein